MVGCFGIFPDKNESREMNQENCIANRNCLAAVSFQYCDKNSNGEGNPECGNVQQEFQGFNDKMMRIVLRADKRYLFVTLGLFLCNLKSMLLFFTCPAKL